MKYLFQMILALGLIIVIPTIALGAGSDWGGDTTQVHQWTDGVNLNYENDRNDGTILLGAAEGIGILTFEVMTTDPPLGDLLVNNDALYFSYNNTGAFSSTNDGNIYVKSSGAFGSMTDGQYLTHVMTDTGLDRRVQDKGAIRNYAFRPGPA